MTVIRRHRITGTLVALAPVHVGSGRGGQVIDLPVFRNGADIPTIPGTALAGVLRRRLAALGLTQDEVGRWMGADDASTASLVVVDDAPVTGGTAQVESRTTVAIDSHTGAAKPGALFGREHLAQGTEFALSLEVEERDGADAEAFLGRLVGLLEAGFAVGAATTRGLGRIRLIKGSLSRQVVPLDHSAGFLQFLAGQTTERGWQPSATPDDLDASICSVELCFEPKGVLMSSVELPGAPVDRVPLTTASSPGKVRLVLPGSGIKGALRARAHYLARTLGGSTDDPAFRALFGAAAELADDKTQIGNKGRLQVHESGVEAEVDLTAWQAVVDAAGEPGEKDEARQRAQARQALRKAADLGDAQPALLTADRVAIDRWTGGAAPGLLYSLLEPHHRTEVWTPLRFNLDLHGVDDTLAHRMMGLLLLTVREVVGGWVPLGYGTRRGLGQIRVTGWSFRVGSDLSSWADLTGWGFESINAAPECVDLAITAFVEGLEEVSSA